MNFCECGAIMVPEKQSNGKVFMRCPACGKVIKPEENSNKEVFEIKQTIRHNDMEKMVVIDDPSVVETMPTVTASCSKCGHNEAVYWELQTRSADEATTTFYRCKKCGNTWRDYG
ncbi:MAG: transcription factor S [Candidatus Hodarchaeales archaeon]